MDSIRDYQVKISSSILTAAILGAGTAWLGLAAAAAGWRWTSRTFTGPAWNHAWLYANTALTMCLFVLFPVLLSRVAMARGDKGRLVVFGHGLALLAAAVPMLITAAWLNHTSVHMLINVSAIQIAFAIFTLGVSVWSTGCRAVGRIVSLGVAAGLFLLPPGIALIQAANFPWLVGGPWGSWVALFPAPIVTLACHNALRASTVGWIVGVYSAMGLAMVFQSVRLASHRTSP